MNLPFGLAIRFRYNDPAQVRDRVTANLSARRGFGV